jgi:predicted dehydrogenase
MTDSVLKIGLLGCGTIAQFAHLPALAKVRSARLTAICDGAEDLLTTVGKAQGVKDLYTDYAEFLEKADIEAVIIAAPDEFHIPLSMQALDAGKHVLVEKPLGVNARECESLIEKLRQTRLKLQVGSMKRHDPGITFSHRHIKESLGPILSISGWYRDTLFRPALQETLLPPVITSEHAVKPSTDPKCDIEHYSLITHGAHLFDILRYLGGEVNGVTTNHAFKFNQHSWHGLLEFDHGGIGNFELTVKVNSDWSEGYVIHGEHGSVEIKTFVPFYYRPSEVRIFDARSEEWHTPLCAHSNPYKRQIEAFAHAVRSDGPVNPDAHDGLATVSLIEAVEAASKSGKRQEIINLKNVR